MTTNNSSTKPTVKQSTTNDMPSSDSFYIPSTLNQPNDTPLKSDIPVMSPLNSDTSLKTEDNGISAASITIENKNRKSGFGFFVGIGIFVILAIYAGVTYLYFQNKNLKEIINNRSFKQVIQVTPTPSFDKNNVVIDQGSIIYKNSENDKKMIIDKVNFPITGITGFTRVAVSPDNSKICFESIPPVTKPGLYVSEISGANSKIVSPNKQNCLWKNDSNVLFYTGKESGISNINIYSYDLREGIESNLTSEQKTNIKEDFILVGLSADESKVICSFTDTNSGKTTQCEIDLQTKGFSLL